MNCCHAKFWRARGNGAGGNLDVLGVLGYLK